MRALLRESLDFAGAEFIECASGEEAIVRCEEALPDWVVMDYRMEPLDGIATTARIRERHPEGRIVIVSNWDEPPLREAAHAAGAMAYVLKDNLRQLHDLIRSSDSAR